VEDDAMAAVLEVPAGVPPLVYQVTWEELPDYYRLPDEPVDNTDHPLLAAALRESLELAGILTGPQQLAATNLGVCATVNGRTVVKAPDWLYVPHVLPPDPPRVRRSYTPHLHGDGPVVVMEFLSDSDGGEYSMQPVYPYGKCWFYERILQVPYYVIFEPEAGTLEVRQLVEGVYEMQPADDPGRYWIEPLRLFLGVWEGTKADRTGHWLRWWDSEGDLLLWGAERLEREHQRTKQESQRAEQERERAAQERQRAEQERERAEQERQRAERLAAYLKAQGIDPDSV
jgi:Uma2 family endonuclease